MGIVLYFLCVEQRDCAILGKLYCKDCTIKVFVIKEATVTPI